MPPVSQNSLYDAIGGEAGISRLVAASVRLLESDPSLAELKRMYRPEHVGVYECHLKEFLSGWLGGPPLYQLRHGLPMLRERHRHRHIHRSAMLDWVKMMHLALEETVPEERVRLRIEGLFSRMAESLVNE